MSLNVNGSTRRQFVKNIALGAAGTAVAGATDFPRNLIAQAKKYRHYVKMLNFSRGSGGPGCADYTVQMTGGEMEGLNTHFSFGYYSKTGEWSDAGSGACKSPYDTCLVFAGLDPGNIDYLGAEIEISLGNEFEKHVIDVPSIVCVPKFMPYGPIRTRKVDKPFAHYLIGLNSEIQTTAVPVQSGRSDGEAKYGHLIKKLSDTVMRNVQKMTGPGNADVLSWPKPEQLEGFIVNFTWGFYNGLGNWHTDKMDPHTHEGDEFLVFVSLDPEKPDDLGAEIDMYMGKEQEVHILNDPCVVLCPGNFVHAPVITKKVDRTYVFFLIRRDAGGPQRLWTPDMG
jgi:hypothetical protein